ncbi:MAG: NAD(+)/NADH kinase [Myxococcales bacterium]|nr:NAD(+)/NADH kinase [Myxococcales bacterium]
MTTSFSRHSQLPRHPRVLAIYKKSAYQTYVRERKNPRMVELLKRKDRSVHRLLESHEAHVTGVKAAHEILTSLGAKVVLRYRSDAGQTDDFDLVVTLGGDGTLLWVSHFVGAETPLLAINTAPEDSVGYYCAGSVQTMRELFTRALKGELPSVRLTRMRIEMDDELVHNRILNDMLFAHECPAATSRYLIEHNGILEDQKSSGVWVGPAAGSTAARRSAGGAVMPLLSKRLQFVVREPYLMNRSSPAISKGYVAPGRALILQSKMRPGRLYLDGSRLQRVVEFGAVLKMMQSDEPLLLLGHQRAR